MRQGFLDFLSEKMNSHVSWLSTEGNGGRNQCRQLREQQWDSQSDIDHMGEAYCLGDGLWKHQLSPPQASLHSSFSSFLSLLFS